MATVFLIYRREGENPKLVRDLATRLEGVGGFGQNRKSERSTAHMIENSSCSGTSSERYRATARSPAVMSALDDPNPLAKGNEFFILTSKCQDCSTRLRANRPRIARSVFSTFLCG